MTTLEDKTWAKYYAKTKLITIDPGKAGGIAVYDVEEGRVIALTTMPETPTDLFNFLKRYAKNSRVYPDQGLNPRPPALGTQSLSHWTIREVLYFNF